MIGEMDENGDTEKLNSQPLLSSSSQEQTFSQHQFQPPINTENEEENTEITSEQYQQQQFYKAKPLHKCKTAPAIDRSAVFRELQAQFKTQAQAQAQNKSQNPLQEEDDEEEEEIGSSGMLMVRQAGILLVIYLVMGVLVYGLNKEQFLKGVETHPVVDALYFCIVTMCTIGYGDITPLTPFTKIFACIFVLVGFGFIDTLLSGVVNYILDVQQQTILSDILHHKANHQVAVSSSNQNHEHNQNHKHKDKHNHRLLHFLTLRLVDVEKGRMRIRLKVGLALSVLVVCMGIGTLFLYIVEEMSLVDSVYLSALSVTTVGYGDRAFNTLTGRLFASVWLLVSTLAVARAFLYLVEARIHKRQRTIAKWVLERDITPSDLFAADINNNDHLNKSEYVLFKLKEMGKIGQQEILQICNQFEKLDSNYMGRITPPDLFRNRPSSMKAENLA